MHACVYICVYARIGVYACMYMCTLMFLILIYVCILSSFHPHDHHMSPNSPRLMFLFVDCATANIVYLILSYLISSHLISFNPISCRLISSHLILSYLTASQQTLCKIHLDPQYNILFCGSTILGFEMLWIGQCQHKATYTIYWKHYIWNIICWCLYMCKICQNMWKICIFIYACFMWKWRSRVTCWHKKETPWCGYRIYIICLVGGKRVYKVENGTLVLWITKCFVFVISKVICHITTLTHWGRDEMNNISQTTLSNVFSSMKMFEFRLKFHWSLFLRDQLIIFQHWFR